jgi:hypothetical protein
MKTGVGSGSIRGTDPGTDLKNIFGRHKQISGQLTLTVRYTQRTDTKRNQAIFLYRTNLSKQTADTRSHSDCGLGRSSTD